MQQRAIGAVFLFLALPLALPLAAVAQTTSAPPSPALKEALMKARAACVGDVQKLCANVERGNALQSCMREHQAELSPDCKSARAGVRAVRVKEKQKD